MSNTTLRDHQSVLWDIYREVNAQAETEDLPKDSARESVITKMSTVYQIDPVTLTKEDEPVLYTNVAKIMRLIFPKSSAAEANLQAEIARGGLGFNDALQIARGKAQTREDCVQPQTSSTTTELPHLDLATLLAAIIAVATDAGYSTSEIASAFSEAIEDHDTEAV